MKRKLILLSIIVSLAACASKSDGGYYGDSTAGSTIIKQKISQLGDELEMVKKAQNSNASDLMRIKEKVIGDVSKYYETVAGISARLQIGTTAGNPMLKEKWRSANAQLGEAASDVEELRRLSAQVGTDSSLTDYIKDSARLAFGISGATEADNNQLRSLTSEVDRVAETSRRMAWEINGEVARHEKFIASEQRKLYDLAAAINVGSDADSLPVSSYSRVPEGRPAARPVPVATTKPAVEAKPAAMSVKPASAAAAPREALVTVAPDETDFDEKVYNAIQSVLDKNPNAKFEVLGIATAASGRAAAEAQAKKVTSALVEMGMPKNRLRTATKIDSAAKASSVGIFGQ